MGVNKVT